jgi:hypothetical protein
MDNKPDWLPELVELSDYHGDWDLYLGAVYSIFKQDFIYNHPIFRGLPVSILVSTLSEGKEETFWHIISEGEKEENRNINIRRSERIRWPKPIIENCDTDKLLYIWENNRGRENRVLIRFIFSDDDYLIILIRRKRRIYLLTAYLITNTHQKKRLQQEYNAYKANAAL